MAELRYLKCTFLFSLAGTLFAGFLSLKKYLTGTCAFNETCPYFLGYPACWYGLILFLSIAIVSIILLRRKDAGKSGRRLIRFLSFAGILFSGYFVYLEIAGAATVAKFFSSSLGLPTCAYGLIFYGAIFFSTFHKTSS